MCAVLQSAILNPRTWGFVETLNAEVVAGYSHAFACDVYST